MFRPTYGPNVRCLLIFVCSNASWLAVTAQDSLRFSNLLARLLDQDLLTRKAAVLQFLSTLSSSPQAPPIIPPLVPSISRSSPSSPLPRSRRTSLVPPSHTPVVTVGAPSSNVKSKAQILREYRGRHGRAGIPEHLLLRDALYLLQGISGKWVKFQEDKTGEMKVVFIDDQVCPFSGIKKNQTDQPKEIHPPQSYESFDITAIRTRSPICPRLHLGARTRRPSRCWDDRTIPLSSLTNSTYRILSTHRRPRIPNVSNTSERDGHTSVRNQRGGNRADVEEA